MEFNAKNLKKITDEARGEKQIKLAHELFDKLQQRSWVRANAGMETAELTDLEPLLLMKPPYGCYESCLRVRA